MDLQSIVRTIWRHKLAAIPVILLTALGVFYVVAIKAPEYTVSSTVVLISPPSPPTPEQIAANPKLGKVNSNNPYVNFGNLSIVAEVVLSVVTSNSSQQALLQAGADPRYQVSLSADYGAPPIIEVTGIGKSAQEAIRSASLVTSAAMTDLYEIQKRQGVNPQYLIKSIELVQPEQAQQVLSGKLRTLIAVLGLGIIMLFIVVSSAQVIENRRRDRSISADLPMRTDAEMRRQSPATASTPPYGTGTEPQGSGRPGVRLSRTDRFPAVARRYDRP